MFKIKNLTILFLILLLIGCSNSNLIGQSNAQSNASVIKTTSINKPSYYVPKPIGKTFTATVVEAIDGDTVKIKLPNGKEETVRLLLIDTPETVHPNKPVQPFGKEASNFAKSFFKPGSKVEVDIDVSERDKYGRLLAYLWKDGVLYQDVVIEKGLARVAYIYPPNTSYVDYFRKNQQVAQKKKIGIWSIENYATDQGFNDNIQHSSNKKINKEQNSNIISKIPDVNGDGKCNDIKGNNGSNGKIYHLPGGAYYEKTKAERYFCTEQEAQKAGYRKSNK